MLLESPTYIGAIAVARAARLRTVPVPTDEQGVQPDQLAAAFAATGARLFYCQPTFHNPTGTVLASHRRGQVLAAAREAGAFVIEDDFARWLSHERPAPPPLLADDTDGRVVHIASLTKATSPNLRVGALIARGPVPSDCVRCDSSMTSSFHGYFRRPHSSWSAHRRGGRTCLAWQPRSPSAARRCRPRSPTISQTSW